MADLLAGAQTTATTPATGSADAATAAPRRVWKTPKVIVGTISATRGAIVNTSPPTDGRQSYTS